MSIVWCKHRFRWWR